METSDISDGELNRFTDSVSHRGPDERGVYRDTEARLAFGHRRLSILDLSETGRQPMQYAGGRYIITYNGEVYNYPGLRSELEGLGHSFAGTSDTEVILAAYTQWGEECQIRFNGMWAFAIWDRKERTLFLSRDRFGVKPLHYWFDGKRFAFASEMKSFLALDWFDPRFDPANIARALICPTEIEGSEDCIFAGVRRLMGGWSLTLRQGGEPKLNRWWNTLDHVQPLSGVYEDQVESFRELFYDACKIRLRSDVPVGSALSGGMDSGSIFCAIAAMRKSGALTEDRTSHDFKAFVASHPGTFLNERPQAEEIVTYTNESAIYEDIDPCEGYHHLSSALFSMEEIYDQFTTPWMLYRKMKEDGFSVSMDGHGGDELLSGYYHYIQSAIRGEMLGVGGYERCAGLRSTLEAMYPDETHKQIPAVNKQALKIDATTKKVAVYGCGSGGALAIQRLEKLGWPIAYFVDGEKSKWGKRISGHEIRNPEVLQARDFDMIIVASVPGEAAISAILEDMEFSYLTEYIYNNDLLVIADRNDVWPVSCFSDKVAGHPWLNVSPSDFHAFATPQDEDRLRLMEPMNRRLYADFHFKSLPTILRNFDRLSMAHGIEIRSPFMDWRLVCLCFSLPWTSKVGNGFTKKILRDSMRGRMPDSILNRKIKIGFGSPLDEWVRGPLKSLITDTVHSAEFLESEIWNGKAVRDNVMKAYAAKEFGQVYRASGYIMANLLLKAFRDKKESYRIG